jgi:HSP20 family protein
MAMERWRPTGLTPWGPFRELEDMERRFRKIFGRPFQPAMWGRFPFEEMRWVPALEMFEKEDKFVVRAELPGIDEKDVDVSVVGNVLTIKGERKTETEVKEQEYHWSEHSYGTFFRSLTLPSNVDAEKIEASYEKGVLEVSIPKAAGIRPKKISVSAKKKEKVSVKKKAGRKKKEKASK